VRNKRGTQVPVRVVTQLAAREGVSTYAIEFVEKDDKEQLLGNHVPVERQLTNPLYREIFAAAPG